MQIKKMYLSFSGNLFVYKFHNYAVGMSVLKNFALCKVSLKKKTMKLTSERRLCFLCFLFLIIWADCLNSPQLRKMAFL